MEATLEGIQKKHPLKMECGVTGGYTNGTTPAGILADVRSERSPSKTGLHVNFKEKGEIKEKREKFLTAKYGHHQMSLIRKRLAVEMWLYEELKKLYENKTTVRLGLDRFYNMVASNFGFSKQNLCPLKSISNLYEVCKLGAAG
ncbi:hypothetical protein NQ318_009049 [Aromia moschata]|uniref:Uncharacterized protein n=1 Tax=Aromia moschata TaxID=1265417 RepID=A0AAV8YUJ8_9CUCU|nr:hypothetical protein NQ318_009049 [Aromia moschata]